MDANTQQTLKCFTCERMLPTTSFHVRKTGKRGYCYDCKECRKTKHAQKTDAEQLIVQDTTPEPSIPDSNLAVACHATTIPNNIVMIAIENSPTFEHLMQIVDYTKGQLDYDALFKIVAAKFPANYMDLFTKLYGLQEPAPEACAPPEPVPTEPVHTEQVQEQVDVVVSEETPVEPTLEQEPQDNYKEQYKNDPNMAQIGEDCESDDEHTTWTVRSGNEWRRIRVKRNGN